ncbi:MAG: hypothetical protein HFH87_18785, partial [Lachnospiraceae bacterium]|nr:hypothetical protein [Lachnospiraceae bacterium]
MKTCFHGKKKLCSLLFTALLVMAVLGGCADGTGESSGDNSSKESVTDSQGTASAQESTSQESAREQEASGDMYGGSVVVGIQQDIDSLDPHKATAAGTK